MIEVQFIQASFPSDAQAVREGERQVIGVFLSERVLCTALDSGGLEEMGRAPREKAVSGAFINQRAVGRRRVFAGRIEVDAENALHSRRPTAHDRARAANVGQQIQSRLAAGRRPQGLQKVGDRLAAKAVGVREPTGGFGSRRAAVVARELNVPVSRVRHAGQRCQVFHFVEKRTGSDGVRGRLIRLCNGNGETQNENRNQALHRDLQWIERS